MYNRFVNSVRERIYVVLVSVFCSGGCGVGDCGYDKVEDVDFVYYILLIRLLELFFLLVFREIIFCFVYVFDCMFVCNIYSIFSGRIFNCLIIVFV